MSLPPNMIFCGQPRLSSLVNARSCAVHTDPETSSGDKSRPCSSRLRINVAGVTCHAWSGVGLQEHEAHSSEIPLAVWMAERVYMMEKGIEQMVFLECTPQFPAQSRLEAAFAHLGARVISLHDCPQLHGWPHRRKRVLACVISPQLEWQGPDSLQECQADYAARFHRECQVDHHLLLQATKDERVEEMLAMAWKRKYRVTKVEIVKMMDEGDFDGIAQLIFPPGAIDRLKAWESHFMKMAETSIMVDIDHRLGEKGPFVAPLLLLCAAVRVIVRICACMCAWGG